MVTDKDFFKKQDRLMGIIKAKGIDVVSVKEQGVAEGSEMIWNVHRQETTLYPNGERDHETEIVKTFTNDKEAGAHADKLNSTNRDEDVYYFVRGKKQGVMLKVW